MPPNYLNEELYIVKSKATCHITRQASVNERALVRYPVRTSKHQF